MSADRRTFTRIPSELEARWDGAEPREVRVRDITLEGAYVRAEAPLAEGEEAVLVVLCEDGSVEIRARVVRVEEEGRGFGVRFVGMDREARQAIANRLLSISAARARRTS